MVKGTIILGASGSIGTETVRALVGLGKAVTAGVRNVNAEKSKELEKIGATVIQADMSLPQQQLAGVLKNYSSVYLVTPGHIDRAQLVKNATAAARDAGVTYLLVVSIPTAERVDTIFGKQMIQVEQAVKQSGINYGIVRLPAFMENIFGNLAPIKSIGTFFGSGNGTTYFTNVATGDAGLASAVILANPEKHVNKTYTIVSNGATFDDTAVEFTKALGRPIKYVNAGPEAVKKGMVEAGLYDWQADGIHELILLSQNGELKDAQVTNDFKEITGKQPASIEGWMRERAALFSN